jgi:hypothetical protein
MRIAEFLILDAQRPNVLEVFLCNDYISQIFFLNKRGIKYTSIIHYFKMFKNDKIMYTKIKYS